MTIIWQLFTTDTITRTGYFGGTFVCRWSEIERVEQQGNMVKLISSKQTFRLSVGFLEQRDDFFQALTRLAPQAMFEQPS